MTASSTALKGVFAAALTPCRPDGKPDLAALIGHNRWLLANGCDGVAPLGTTGEANSLGIDDRLEIIAAVGAQLPRDRVMIGTGAPAVGDAVKLSKAAVAAGCPHVLMLPPFYYKAPSDDGLFAFYARVIEQVGSSALRIYLYHFPAQSAVPITHALIERLLKEFPTTVVGLKDSTGDWAHTESLCKSFPGFATFAGTETLLLPTFQAGGVGCISAAANVTAPICGRLRDAWQAGKDATALQEQLVRIRKTLQTQPIIPALKAVTRRRSGDAIWQNLLPPNLPLGEAQEAALMRDLQAVDFFDSVGQTAVAAS